MVDPSIPRVRVDIVMRYTCPCGHVNVRGASERDMDDDTREALADDGIDPDTCGVVPEILFCQRCEAKLTPANVEDAEDT